jgi:hypothetical protein
VTAPRLLRLLAPTVLLLLPLLGAGGARALTLEPIGPGFAQPTYVASDPGDPNRLYVVEREGTIELVEGGVVSQLVDLSGEVECGGKCNGDGERGLLSMALAPDFDTSRRLYVDYVNYPDGTIHVAELVAEPNLKTASLGTLEQLLEIEHSEAKNHNGGQLQLGPDGALYVSTGDGGGGNDQFHHSQKANDPLGKILRLDPEETAPVTPEVWSLGLRNPYRFSFDALTGDMVIGDVGQGAREEVDLAPSPFPGIVGGEGVNYGWNCREGPIAGPADDLAPGECESDYAAGSFVDPVFDYGHNPDPDLGTPSRCSITGGYVVRDPALGALDGSYVYSDYCSGVIRSLRLPSGVGEPARGDCSLGLRVDSPVSFGEDAANRLYVVEQNGQIFRFAGQPPAGCPAQLPVTPPLPTPPPRPPAAGGQATGGGADPAPGATVPTFVGIKAERRRVEPGGFALLTAFVSPCDGRRGQSIELLRNGAPNGTRYLSRACTARFVRHIAGDASFAALTPEQGTYLPGRSRQLTIRLAQPRRR